MDKFEQKEIKQKRSIKDTFYEWLINYIPKPKRKSAGSFKDKIEYYWMLYNIIEYESNIERNKTLPVNRYLNEIKPHLKD